MRFSTKLQYDTRESKARYVWDKYRDVLNGKILDVGADERYLRTHLPEATAYWGIGLGGHPDQQVDLEQEGVPFPDHAYDCVLCLDVLEHLENPHFVFDELCRVSRKYVIIALPNAWTFFWRVVASVLTRSSPPDMKYYGLPGDPPVDRHKWFFSAEEAERFVRYRSQLQGFDVIQVDDYQYVPAVRRAMRNRLLSVVLTDKLFRNLTVETVWIVIARQ